MSSSVAIGPSGHQVSIPIISSVIAPIWRKSACFDRLQHTFRQQLHSHSIPELITALDEALPIETTAATETALNIRGLVIEAATDINNLEPIAFLGRNGFNVDVEHPSPDKRPEGISYIRLRCCIQGSNIDKRICQPDFNFEFALALPQACRDNVKGDITSIFGHQPVGATITVNTKQSCMFKPKPQQSSSAPFSISWYGSSEILDNQDVFNKEFGSKTPQLLHTNPKTGEALETVSKLYRYADLCQFDIALELCRYDYVGSNNTIDSTLAVQEVCK